MHRILAQVRVWCVIYVTALVISMLPPVTRNQSQCCPLDNKPLSSDTDIFPDNFTRREISQIRNACPNASAGCPAMISPLEMDEHLLQCQYQRKMRNLQCSFARLNCNFVANTETELNLHMRNDISSHLNVRILALKEPGFNKISISAHNGRPKSHELLE